MNNQVKSEIKKNKTIQHEIPENRINKIHGENNKQDKISTPVNSNACVSQNSMTLDDNMVLNTSDDAKTNADTSNKKDKSLKVLNDNSTYYITIKDDNDSMDIINDGASTSTSTNTNAKSGIDYYTIHCKMCKQDFASSSDYENHLIFSTYENSKICIHQEEDIVKKIMECIPKDYYVSAKNNGLPNDNYLSKGAWEPDENHMKALEEPCEVEQPFFCEFCNGLCEEFDHYQFNQWCSLNKDLKCYVCNQGFFDKERLQQHEKEHVKLNMC